MPSPSEQLAQALRSLKGLQDRGQAAFQSSELPKADLGCLQARGWVKPIFGDWHYISNPQERDGDTTSWNMSFWDFVGRYCDRRFGEDWCLSPDASLLIHSETRTPPHQIIIHSPGGHNNRTDLPLGRSLFDLKSKALAPGSVLRRDGLNVLTPEATLMELPVSGYQFRPQEAEAVLAGLRTVGGLERAIVRDSKPIIGGRLIGALRHIGLEERADRIEQTMRMARMQIRPENPFVNTPSLKLRAGASPIETRLRAFWASYAPVVAGILPEPAAPGRTDRVLRDIDATFVHDAYNSLSIEGYQVTPELIEKVRAGSWDPDGNPADRDQRNALAAKGYWIAFQEVREFIRAGLEAPEPTDRPRLRLVQEDWFRSLFQPSVNAGLSRPQDFIGYRDTPVFIRTAEHVPPSAAALPDAMDTYFDLLEAEPHPGVRAVLGHWMLGYVHPYPDGNGRLARFTMNAMLAEGGYDWVVVELGERSRYMAALDQASVRGDIGPFATLIAEHLRPKGLGERLEETDSEDTPPPP